MTQSWARLAGLVVVLLILALGGASPAAAEELSDPAAYGPFDAAIVILREGMEAMLVVVALVAFVKRSGNDEQARWIWGGAASGIGASIVLGVAVNVALGSAFSGEDRELLAGVTGLLAAAMLLYVSYWLHSNASLSAWQAYVRDRATRALASGSMYGLAALAFLAVFREGGEMVLFFLGLAGNIATGDLLLGLAGGALVLLVAGIALTVAGLRVPMRPFFMAASALTFYLCVKFVGTGVHELQEAGMVAERGADFLPSSDLLGLYPTWQSTAPQLLLLAFAAAVVARGVLADRAARRARA